MSLKCAPYTVAYSYRSAVV